MLRRVQQPSCDRASHIRRRPGPRRRAPRSSLALAELAYASLLADLAAQVVELRAVHVADRLHLDLVDLRRVKRERPLDADTERVLADGKRLADAGALALEDDALEDLDALAGALDDAEVDANGVARLEARDLTQLAALDVLNDCAHGEEGREAARMVAESVNRQRIVIRLGGQYVANTLPIRSFFGTVPHARESHDALRLSPIMKYWFFGILIGAIVLASRRSGRTYGSFSFLPSM